MNKLKVGYASVNINAPLGIAVYGYYVPRFAKGYLDDLEAEALALCCDDKKIIVIAVDAGAVPADFVDECRELIEKETGVLGANVLISASHSHTTPFLRDMDMFDYDLEPVFEYREFVKKRLLDAAKLALDDIRPARMGYIVGYAPERVAYIRRYKMKDGTTMTCPPLGDPNIDYPIGELDRRVNVLRFDREGAESVVFVNYGLHADCIGGELLSADWPGWMRKTVEKALEGCKCMFFAGAEGDVGSTNINPTGGDMNDTEISFDNEMKSPGMARFVGRALAGTVLQVFDKVHYIDVDDIGVIHKEILIPANLPTAEELVVAKKYKALHDAGKDEEIPFSAMELTTVVAEAARMCKLEKGSENFRFDLMGIKIGDVAMVGIPGEPFTEIGVELKKAEGWVMIMPCAQTNGDEGYFPMKSAYDEGGYESRSSVFKSGVAEKIIDGGTALLDEMRKK
ncbi:MAG: hypothetical protein IJN96_03425 [Clostridia bacterium]|nr:hypothetical protein [Clostridia bacterium]